MFRHVKVRTFEVGLVFRDREFRQALGGGAHRFFDPFNKVRVDVVDTRQTWLAHDQLDVIVKSGALADRTVVVDLKDHERALIWIDGRFSQILNPGMHVHWKGPKEVRVEVVDARSIRFAHEQFKTIVRSPNVARALEVSVVQRDRAGVLFLDGRYVETLAPGEYAFWRGVADVKLVEVDLREQTIDIGGQEIMTADKVTLRVNVVVTYKVVDARKTISQTDSAPQALYRDAQLALRAIVGARELDAFLSDKDAVSKELDQAIRARAAGLGLELVAVGVRDVILPGDMKELMNKVTEARKAAEANLIARREETAAIRSQSNTAKLLADSPTLMRLRELEVLEKIATAGKLNVFLGEKSSGDKGLAEKIVNLL